MTNAVLSRLADLRIDDERPCDVFARETLLDEAFGPARFRKTCQRLRVGRLPARGLSLVARDGHGSRVLGTVRLWHVTAGGTPALVLGPLAVARSHRGLGIGDALMRESLARARRLGHRAIILVGDAPYYAKFGFSHDVVAALAMPGPVEIDRFLGLALEPDALSGARGRVVATGEKDRFAVKRGRTLRRAA